MNFAKFLLDRGMTKERLAAELGCSVRSVERYVAGKKPLQTIQRQMERVYKDRWKRKLIK